MMKKQKRTSRPSALLLPPPPPLQPLVLLPPGLLRPSSSTLSFVELFPFSTKSPPSRSTSLSLSVSVRLTRQLFFFPSLAHSAGCVQTLTNTQSRRENNREMTTEKNYDDFEPAAEPTSIVTSPYLTHPRRRRVDHLDRSPTSRKLSRTSFKIQFSSCIEGFLPTLSRPHTHKHTSLSTTFSSC